jgi:hypothetical protein
MLFTVLVTSCGNSQTKNQKRSLSGNVQADLEMLLSQNKVKAEIMDGIVNNPRLTELTKKFQAAIQKNYDWFIEYMKKVPDGEEMPYDEKIGLTKGEYAELLGYMNNIELKSTGQEFIFINKNNGIVYFQSQNKLSNFDSLTIDLKKNVVHFGQYELPFSDSVNVTKDKNGLKSKWKGYNWKLEEPKNFGPDDLKNLETVNVKSYTFTIGQLDRNGKTYMSLKGREIKNGEKTVEFELPVVF